MLKVAIVGSGAISDSHIQAYLKFKNRCQIVAIGDLYPEKAKEKAVKHGLEATVFKDHQELLQGTDFDLVSICVPPFGHAQVAVDMLRAGKHVLVEKPMATSLQECDEMIAAAHSTGRQLSVVAQNRFKTPMMKLKRVLEANLIGRLLHAQVDSLWWRGSNYYNLWWRGTWEKEGGGCTMNHAVHHIDLFQWMIGLPTELRAVTANLGHENSEVEDFSTTVLTYPDGAIGQITASLVHHGEDQQFAFQGQLAKVAFPWHVKASTQRENGFPDENPALTAEIQSFYDQLPAVPQQGHDGQIANFLAAIEGREDLLVDGGQGRKTLELITAIYHSAQFDRRVSLPLTTDDPFYTRASILKTVTHFHEKTKSVENFADNEITLGRKMTE